jgi:hypothetical protein
MNETVIVDYGMANLRSVQKGFERVGHAAVITSDAARIADAAKLVLPGVGAFRDAIAKLHDDHFAEPIRAATCPTARTSILSIPTTQRRATRQSSHPHPNTRARSQPSFGRITSTQHSFTPRKANESG